MACGIFKPVHHSQKHYFVAFNDMTIKSKQKYDISWILGYFGKYFF